MKILYLLDSTVLCGGVKIVFCQAQALERLGHDVSVICGEDYPDWFDGHVNYICGDIFDNTILKRFEHVVATSPLHVLHLCKHGCKFCDTSYTLWHLVQGYEGELEEALHLKDRIVQGYRLPIRRITVSHRLCMKLKELFPGMWCRSAGQGIEHDIFYPDEKAVYNRHEADLDLIRTRLTINHEKSVLKQGVLHINSQAMQVKSIIISGPFTMPVKNIEKALLAFNLVKKKYPDIDLIRISSIDTKDAEEKITGKIKHYHVRLTAMEVADVLRASNGVLLSVSLPAEGFGLPGIEAMACAVPVVLSDIPAHRSYDADWEENNIFRKGYDSYRSGNYNKCDYAAFVSENTPEAMADAIDNLIRDRKKCQHHIKQGLSVASSFSFADVAKRLETFFSPQIELPWH